MARVLKAPTPLPAVLARPAVFLAGSIEMGRAEDWQTELTRALDDLDVLVLNPRRDDWDSSWRQQADDPQFRTQVEWELEAQERASLIAMYFAPSTQAPVTLLELGLFARTGKLIVCCPEGFWRKGNVDLVCRRHGIATAPSLPDLAAHVRRALGERGA
jgi:Nucleoside 2-deoxyribosyltransferase like